MKSYSHWGMFHCWEAPGLPPMAEQPQSWVHVDIGSPYPIAHYTLAEILTPHSNPAQIATYWPHEDDLKLTITRELK